MTDATDKTLLTLVAPRALEEPLLDLLLAHKELVPGFTTTKADGHGTGVRFETVAEHVRGRAQRVRVQMVLPLADAQSVVAIMEQELSGSHIYWWMSPVLAEGRIA